MILDCPVCGSLRFEAVLALEQAPIFQLLGPGQGVTPEHFAPLEVVSCQACGHFYNRAYEAELGSRMYDGQVLSNVPVHISMSQELEKIARWIGQPHYGDKRVIEVGAGSGHLARILARSAGSVVLFEPSAGLRVEMVPEKNITLVNQPFAASLAGENADLIVCRQVLEHVADPLALLLEMRAALVADGCLYLEVPRAEYIEEQAALFDLHCAHVQYFHERNLLALAARAGLAPERQWLLKGGHDFGVLLRLGKGALPSGTVAPVPDWGDLAARLERRRAQGRARLAALPGEVGLYGATWQGVAFLTAFQGDRRFALALDDNPDYQGFALYSREQVVPVRLPTEEILAEVNAVVITAYLHDQVIAERLRAMGFSGPILSARGENSVSTMG